MDRDDHGTPIAMGVPIAARTEQAITAQELKGWWCFVCTVDTPILCRLKSLVPVPDDPDLYVEYLLGGCALQPWLFR